jgi:ElaB/YqjD/DUF883 family membrane-anchored ribosome-binding protein
MENPTGTAASGAAGDGGNEGSGGRFDRAKELLNEKYSAASDAVKEKVSAASDAVKEKYSAAKEKLDEVDFNGMADQVRSYVRSNPGKALLISVGIGFVIGLLLRRDDED